MKKIFIVATSLCCYVATCLAGGQVLLTLPVSAQEKPNFTVISPQENEKVFGDKVIFSFFVSNFILNIDGYLQFSLDGNKPFVIKEQKDFPIANISEGKHILSAELIDKKRQSFSPIIKKEIVFSNMLSKNQEKAINLEISPVETKKITKEGILLPVFLGIGGIIFLILALKLYINTKTG